MGTDTREDAIARAKQGWQDKFREMNDGDMDGMLIEDFADLIVSSIDADEESTVEEEGVTLEMECWARGIWDGTPWERAEEEEMDEQEMFTLIRDFDLTDIGLQMVESVPRAIRELQTVCGIPDQNEATDEQMQKFYNAFWKAMYVANIG